MKFRISGKDFAMFVVFVLLLLYLCAIAVTNLTSFTSSGEFYGLNPIPAFTNYFGATMILFFIFIILIFTSVSSSVFERKKGIGFEIADKSEKGYSRWAKEKEMKNDKGVEVVNPLDQESKYAGIPLVNDGKRLWVDNGEYHNLVIGATGSGKSQTVVEPMVELLIKKGESMIITDPKGELYKAASNYMRERGYNVILLNFREPQNGNAWNPLTLPYQYYIDGNKDKSTELLDDVALNILYDPNNKGEPFWEKSAADYFSGLALGLFEDAKEEEINLNSINYMSTIGEEKFAASNYIKEYFTMKGESSNAYVFASNTINAPADTKGGILSVFRQKIRLFASRENLSEMLAYSDFDMRNIGKQKTAVFIVIHDEKTTYHGLATIFIKQCYESLIDVAQNNGGKLPYRTNFILDEFANMPPLKDVTTMVTAARSRDIRFTFIIQNFAQLKSVYGPENAETIKGNCGNLVYLISTELAALEEISKMCGEVKSGDKDKTASTPLVTVTDLQKLKLFEAIIIRWRLSPFKTKYTPNFKMNWGHPHTEGTYPTRKEKEVQLFNVKEFVKEKKRQNMMNSLGKDEPSRPANPFGGRDTNPFGGSNNDSGLFGGFGGGGIDLDAMMRDIDKKIAELDAEEARKKEELAKQKADSEKKEVAEKLEVKSAEPKAMEAKVDVPVKSAASDFDFLPKEKPKYDMESKIEEPKVTENNNISAEFKTPVSEIKQGINENSYNIFNQGIDSVDNSKNNINGFNDISNASSFNIESKEEKKEISLSTELPSIPVATSSPYDLEDDFDFNSNLPKVENVDVIKPNYSNGINVKTNNDLGNYNIYNTIPNIMENIKDDIKNATEVKNETDLFVDSISKNSNDAFVEKKKVEELKTPDLNIYTKEVPQVIVEKPESNLNKSVEIKENTEKPNVNIDVDSVLIDDNVISDDEFFDDFFGDD